MSNALLFLLGALVVIALGWLVLFLSHRGSPTRLDASVDQVGERLRSLAPRPASPQPRRTVSSPIPGRLGIPDRE